jgi:hypothetical protein
VNTTNAGVGGLSVSNSKNINFSESATSAYATLFRQNSSASLCLNYGYQIGAGANSWASSFATTARSSIAVGAGVIRFYTDASSTVAVGTDITPTERMRIDTTGVNIKGIVNFEAISGSSNGWNVYTYTDNSLRFNYNGAGADEVTIDSSGNVGIGNNSPTYKLDVAGFSRGAIVHRAASYNNGGTTLSVSGVTALFISNSSATTITNFTDGVNEQVIYLYFNDSNTTINRSNAYLAGGANFVSTRDDMLVLIKNGANWYEISRSANS